MEKRITKTNLKWEEVKRMKKLSMILIVVTMLFGFGVYSAHAVYMPPAGSPLYIKFTNLEQLSPTQSIVAPSGTTEVNWGIAIVSDISLGTNLIAEPYEFPRLDPPIWSAILPGEITAIFYGVQLSPNQVAGQLNSYNGSILLFWDDVENAQLGTATPGQRITDTTFTNFTDGQLLVKLDFYNGAILPGDNQTAIFGDTLPQVNGFTGDADSYANVDLSAGGLWATLMDGNYFPVANGLPNADVRFKNSYNDYVTWDNLQNGIFGAVSDDPARNYTVPEPSTMLLLGFGLLGLAGLGYRKRMK